MPTYDILLARGRGHSSALCVELFLFIFIFIKTNIPHFKLMKIFFIFSELLNYCYYNRVFKKVIIR